MATVGNANMLRTWLLQIEEAADIMYALVMRLGNWLRRKRLWWRYRWVNGPYPPHHRDNGEKYRWRTDLRAAFRNQPDRQRSMRRYGI
jgi:hypothetical protein